MRGSYTVNICCQYSDADNIIDCVWINTEGIDNKNIDETGLMVLKIFLLLPINIDRVRCVLTIFSVLHQP